MRFNEIINENANTVKSFCDEFGCIDSRAEPSVSKQKPTDDKVWSTKPNPKNGVSPGGKTLELFQKELKDFHPTLKK